jgi:hypothetical protein
MRIKYFLIIVFFISVNCSLIVDFAFADSTHVSFQSLNRKSKYTSVSFGMGALYGNNPSLKKFIQYKIPDYSFLNINDQLSEFATGIDFFVGVEKQITNNFSVKGEYSYFIKSYNVNNYTQYNFSYYSHQPYVMFYYIIPQEYSYIKLGAGTGYILSNLTVKEFGTENSYTSGGIGFQAEAILNAQIGKSFAGYLSVYISDTFLSSLKDKNNKELLNNVTGETVKLSSLGAGIRFGVEFFIF